jgi:hypothetical protein
MESGIRVVRLKMEFVDLDEVEGRSNDRKFDFGKDLGTRDRRRQRGRR